MKLFDFEVVLVCRECREWADFDVWVLSYWLFVLMREWYGHVVLEFFVFVGLLRLLRKCIINL
jgi:hypothetical protein